MHSCIRKEPSIPPPHPWIYTGIYTLHRVYFTLSLFVNGNGGAPKGRWKGNKWRIFSLLNGALEGLWLGVVGYKTQQFGCTHVLVHWLMGWQLSCLGVILDHAFGACFMLLIWHRGNSGLTGGRFRDTFAPLHQCEWHKTERGSRM